MSARRPNYPALKHVATIAATLLRPTAIWDCADMGSSNGGRLREVRRGEADMKSQRYMEEGRGPSTPCRLAEGR